MVRYPSQLDETELRSLFETLSTEGLDIQPEFKAVIHANSKCVITIPLSLIDTTAKGKLAVYKIVLSWTKTTGNGHVQTGAAVIDRVTAIMVTLDLYYRKSLGERDYLPAPPGLDHLVSHLSIPAQTSFGGNAVPTVNEETGELKTPATSKPAMPLPKDSDFKEAIEAIAVSAIDRLSSYPDWRNYLVAMLETQFGLGPQNMGDWESQDFADVGMDQAQTTSKSAKSARPV